MLIDDVTIRVEAGHGGKGGVAFDKNKFAIGPTGGNGGRGGSIYLEGSPDLNALEKFRFKKTIKAAGGKEGRGQFVDGTDGEDIVVSVPAGTVIHNLTTGFDSEITDIGQRVQVAAGGNGGKGNFKFRSSRNTSPKESQPGLPGESYDLRLELKLIADVGLIGLPNAGKSSLLEALTNAHPKIANYPFTTLEPNLGSYYGLIIADIPGLIEGAAEGKGLGIKFLRHIERTKVLFHLISAEQDDPVQAYQTIRAELRQHSDAFDSKPEYVFLSKSDTVNPNELDHKIKKLKKVSRHVLALSVYDDQTITGLQKILNGFTH